jgi:hypothetical protein
MPPPWPPFFAQDGGSKLRRCLEMVAGVFGSDGRNCPCHFLVYICICLAETC